MEKYNDWKTKTLLIRAGLGLAAGLAAAIIIIQSTDEENAPQLKAGDGV